MLAYCNNNPVMGSDPIGQSPFGALNIVDYYYIHRAVQWLCVADMGWDMEVYVKGPLGNGRLDLYDAKTNSYYEVKSKRASEQTSTATQMKRYDVALIASDKYVNSLNESPSRGTEYVSGTFAYGMYDVNFYTKENGLIVYETELNSQRTLKTAVILIMILAVATGNIPTAVGAGSTLPAFA